MYYVATSVKGYYSHSPMIEENSAEPLQVFLIVHFKEKWRRRDGTTILEERVTAEATHSVKLQSPSSLKTKRFIWNAISLLRRPQISNGYAMPLANSASIHIDHAIATGTKSLDIFVSIAAIEEFEESREEEIPSRVLQESEELAQERGFGGGSSSTAIVTLKMQKYQGGELNERCIICMEEYLTGEDVATMLCEHAYHKECIVQWLRNRNSCPLCRVKLQES